eukprot:gene14276-19153_t
MPPKPQVFKTPDGKEFSTRTEWRDYMMANFYTFKNKVNESNPLIKSPGDIEGQVFDIADCENSTLVVMDHTEQVQIDMVKGCRVFIGACASSIFIRNCDNCTFYTCCRQLRLREVTNCTFYIYSMSEVHIEYSNSLRFAPFNGGYPEQSKHLTAANLDIKHNLWYDIYDHNDAAKSHANWSLLPESDYEAPWFPQGIPCEPAIPKTLPGSVVRNDDGGTMQSFSLQQLVKDAKANTAAPPPTTASQPTAPTVTNDTVNPPTIPTVTVDIPKYISLQPADDVEVIVALIESFIGFKIGNDFQSLGSSDFRCILPNGLMVSLPDYVAAASPYSVVYLKSLFIAGSRDMACSVFQAKAASGGIAMCSAVFESDQVDGAFTWKVKTLQISTAV